ncbi:type I-F CRISPR-associated endoribonuclease Cas6/Csy4, partial [Thermococcus sp.]|uniref:type I-F CRISPR-associated endoribonuclease Cas6/Csy4 n=1 Tax=Thermococcus sp. TaxID=35749 RepID=UPI00261F2465
ATLEKLTLDDTLADLTDYVTISEIRQTPAEHGHVVFRRKQFKTNPQRQARRYAKRHGVSYEEALQRYATFDVDEKIQNNKLPYFNFHSSSTGQKTRIFIVKGTVEHPREGKFTTFGLSKCDQAENSKEFDLSKCPTLPDF